MKSQVDPYHIANTQSPSPPPLGLRSQSHAYGKVILVGEHGVVYGAQAIAMPVSQLQLNLSLMYKAGGKHEVYVNGSLSMSEILLQMVDECFELLNLPVKPCRLDAFSDLPIGAGLGSSAALCVAIVRIFLKFFGIPSHNSEVAALANQLEHRFHGKPSGLDTSVVAHEKIIHFCKNHEPQIIEIKPTVDLKGNVYPFSFALIDSKIRSSTKSMLRQAAPFFQQKTAEKVALFNELSQKARCGLESGVQQLVIEAMNEAGHLLDRCGVVPPSVRHLLATIRECGASAVKPTGAGGGGFCLALLPYDATQAVLQRLQARLGAQVIGPLEFFP